MNERADYKWNYSEALAHNSFNIWSFKAMFLNLLDEKIITMTYVKKTSSQVLFQNA